YFSRNLRTNEHSSRRRNRCRFANHRSRTTEFRRGIGFVSHPPPDGPNWVRSVNSHHPVLVLASFRTPGHHMRRIGFVPPPPIPRSWYCLCFAPLLTLAPNWVRSANSHHPILVLGSFRKHAAAPDRLASFRQPPPSPHKLASFRHLASPDPAIGFVPS